MLKQDGSIEKAESSLGMKSLILSKTTAEAPQIIAIYFINLISIQIIVFSE